MSARSYWGGVMGLVALRAAAALALWWGLPAELQFWQVYDSYTEAEYVRMALGFGHGVFIASYRTIGFPLLLTPLVWFTGATSFQDVLAPAVLLQGCVLAGALIVLVGEIMRRCTGRRDLALLAAGLWALLPGLVYACVHFRAAAADWSPYADAVLRTKRLGYLMQMEAAPDGVNLLCVLVGVWALVRCWQEGGRRWAWLGGAALGWASITLTQSFVLAVALLWWLRQVRRERWSLAVTAFMAVGALQLCYNVATSGAWMPATWLTQDVGEMHDVLPQSTALWSVAHVWGNWWRILARLSWPLLGAVGMTAVLIVIGMRRCWVTRAPVGWLLVLWCMPHLLAFSTYWGFWMNALRYALPIVPAACLALAAALMPPRAMETA